MSAAGAAPSAIISTGSLEKVMELLLLSPLTSVSINFDNNLQLTISTDTSTQNLGVQPAGVLQRALSTLPATILSDLPTSYVAPPARLTSSVAPVVPHMSESGSHPSRKRQKLTTAFASAMVKKLTAEECDAILIKAYEKNRVVRDEVDAPFYHRRVHHIPVTALVQDLYNFFVPFGEIVDIKIVYQLNAVNVGYVVFGKPEFAEKAHPSRKRRKLTTASLLASARVKELTAEDRDAILIKAFHNNRVVNDEVNATFYRRRVYVHNIPRTALPQDLYNFFVPFGEIVDTKIVYRSDAVNVGYVVFEKPEFAEKAVNFGSEIEGQEPDILGPEIEWHAGSIDCSVCGIFF